MDSQEKLADTIADTFAKPLDYVMLAFDWGHGDLAGQEGPDTWQADVLRDIGDGVFSVGEAIRIAVASGHGIGKSALVSWIIIWAMSTRPHLNGVVTANTAKQLETKTWRELAVWHKRAINRDWFEWTATKFYQVDHPDTWFVSAIPWREENSEAFAGQHAEHVLVLYDEASAVADVIWEVSEGAMTTPGAIWCAFGNPTRNTGRFRECFGRFKHRWISRQIDSRTAKMTNKAQLDQWIEDYGEDSDFVRVRVRGQFPRSGSSQLIPADVVEQCREYTAEGYESAPKIIGVDVARFGDDESVITKRQGRKVFPQLKFRGLDTMELASRVAEVIKEWGPDGVLVDGVGVGGGVVDRLRQLGHDVIDVNAGAKADLSRDADKNYANKRAEMYCALRDHMKSGIDLPEDVDLESDLIAVEYGFTPKQQLILEKKSDMKKRGLSSPDSGDSLALTYAYEVQVSGDGWGEPINYSNAGII